MATKDDAILARYGVAAPTSRKTISDKPPSGVPSADASILAKYGVAASAASTTSAKAAGGSGVGKTASASGVSSGDAAILSKYGHTSRPIDVLDSHDPDPWRGVRAVATGARDKAGQGAGFVIDKLDRPRQATQAAIVHGGGKFFPTLVGGESGVESDANRAEIRKRLGMPSGEERAQAHGLRGFIDDFAVDALTDPTLFFGKFKLGEKAFEGTGRLALPAFSKAVHKIAHSDHPAAAEGLASAFDHFNFKGSSQRALARTMGAQGMDKFAGLKAINNARLRRGDDLGGAMVKEFRSTINGLTEEHRQQLYDAVHNGTTEQLPPFLQPKAEQFSQLTDGLAYLSGTRTLRTQLGEHGFQLPDSLKRFDTSVRSLQRPSQYRKDYVPTAHEMDTPLGMGSRAGSLAELDARIRGEVKNTRTMLEAQHSAGDRVTTETTRGLKAGDKNLEERGDHALLLDPEMQEKVIESRLHSGARAISARDAEREVSRLFGVGGFAKAPAAAKAFFQETYHTADDKSFWAGLARGAVDVPKQVLFAFPFRHMANISTLSLFADPSISNVTGTAGKFAKLLAAGEDAGKREAAIGAAGRYGVTGVPSIDKQTGWVGKIPLIGDIYKTSSHVLWAFDDAAKAQRFQKLHALYQARGLKESDAGYRAANQVGAELIDYSNRSPFTQALAYIAPFATYRTKLPGAIGRTLVQHPERVNIAHRLSPAITGGEAQADDGSTVTSHNPLSDTLQLGDNPAKFARSTVAPPMDWLASLLGISLGQTSRFGRSQPHFMTYNKKPDWNYLGAQLLGAMPFGNQLSTAAGINPFPARSAIEDFISGQTGVSVRP